MIVEVFAVICTVIYNTTFCVFLINENNPRVVLAVAEIANPRHPTHCKAIRQQILQYRHTNAELYCSSAA